MYFIILLSPNIYLQPTFSVKNIIRNFFHPNFLFLSFKILKSRKTFIPIISIFLSKKMLSNQQETRMMNLDFDSFEMSPNLVLFDFDCIAPKSCFVQMRQSPRHNTPSPRHRIQYPTSGKFAQLNWVPFVDISAKDFELLLGQNSSGSKRKLDDDSTKNPETEVTHNNKELQRRISSKINFKTKSATKKRSKTSLL